MTEAEETCMRLAVALCVAYGVRAAAVGQTAPQQDIIAEAAQAKALYQQNNFLGALPLYEDLHQRDPKNVVYEEALGMCLMGKASSQTGAEREATANRAIAVLRQAEADGDTSPLLTTVLEKINAGDAQGEAGVGSPAQGEYNAGETAFSKGSLQEALAHYKKALEIDPKFYNAALYAGDALFKSDDCKAAGEFYARAIQIDPDRETAYRYYGDCLMKLNDPTKAEEMYARAIVAQPYQKTTRGQLAQWAKLNHAIIAPPPIQLPGRAKKDEKNPNNTNITIFMDPSKSKDEGAMDLVYSMNSALWQSEKFKKTFPNEKSYRHSLAEEVDGIDTMLSVLEGNKVKDAKLSPSAKSLRDLKKDGMLECWILLDDADQGIAQDYVAYRRDHRELMVQYILKYEVHGK